MRQPSTRGRGRATLAVIVILAMAGQGAQAAQAAQSAPTAASATSRHESGDKDRDTPKDFVAARGANLVLNGKPYQFAGTNNYYLGYKSPAMADAVLDDAKAAGFDVIRTWGSMDFQNPDGSGSVQQGFEGVWYQAWDATAGHPVVNTGPNGLQKLDRVIAEASKRGLRLIIPFVNNWNSFGGMDQYVRWAGDDEHADFYTDSTIRAWYKTWVSTILNRVNTLTGVAYKDDPTIMSWELANEPRCTSAGVYPNGTCDTTTITTWASEMSAYIKTIDRHHLLSAGDEGFFCRDKKDWTLDAQYGPSAYGPGFGENCADGVDTIALASLPSMDMMSLHLYPDNWKTSTAWGTGWLKAHAAAARRIGKPVYLGEFGLQDKATRMPVYNDWLRTVRNSGIDGALYWILSSRSDDGSLYPDYDGFTVYCPSPVCTLMTAHAGLVSFPSSDPRAHLQVIPDSDVATTVGNAAVRVNLLANDVSMSAPIRPSTLDLDPSTAGRQTSVIVAGGTVTIVGEGTIEFVPAPSFVGTVVIPYSVGNGLRSGTAMLSVTVKPIPGAAVVLESWENGVNGWAPGNWQTDPGSLASTQAGATDGTKALEITARGSGAWFGSPALAEPLDLTTRSAFEIDVKTGATGTSIALAVRHNDSFTWCQSSFTWIPENTSGRYSIALSSLGCDVSQVTSVRDVLLFVNAGTTVIDRLAVI